MKISFFQLKEIINNQTTKESVSFLELKELDNKIFDDNYLYVKNLFNEPQIKDFVNELEKKDFNLKRLENNEKFEKYAKENEKNEENLFGLLEKSTINVEENPQNLVFSLI